MKIYMAGPLFTAGERYANEYIASLLRTDGHEVFLPQESEQQMATARQIFRSDVAGIDWADVVLACMDGPDPDSGTCWECGYAYARNKPVIQYRTDFRADKFTDAPYNLMLTESALMVLQFPTTMPDPREAGVTIVMALRGLTLQKEVWR